MSNTNDDIPLRAKLAVPDSDLEFFNVFHSFENGMAVYIVTDHKQDVIENTFVCLLFYTLD